MTLSFRRGILLQSALASTWPHWGRVRTGQPEAYVRKVMVRTYGGWWRRKWRGERPTADLPEGEAADAYDGANERVVLGRALAGLPLGQRQVVVLRYFEDLSEREVADVLDCSIGTVKSQGAKGSRSLRAALGSQTPIEEAR